MSTSIASSFTVELITLDERVKIALKDLEGLRMNLLAFIKQDGTADLAEQAEALLSILAAIHQLFEIISKEIEQQQSQLKVDELFVEDSAINDVIRNKQDSIRQRMLAIEKNNIEVKYSCFEFLSSALWLI